MRILRRLQIHETAGQKTGKRDPLDEMNMSTYAVNNFPPNFLSFIRSWTPEVHETGEKGIEKRRNKNHHKKSFIISSPSKNQCKVEFDFQFYSCGQGIWKCLLERKPSKFGPKFGLSQISSFIASCKSYDYRKLEHQM